MYVLTNMRHILSRRFCVANGLSFPQQGRHTQCSPCCISAHWRSENSGKTSAVSGLIFVHCRMINLIPFSDGECAKYAKYAIFFWVPDFGNFIYGIPKVRHPLPDIFTQFPKSGTQCRRWVPGAGCRTSGTPGRGASIFLDR